MFGEPAVSIPIRSLTRTEALQIKSKYEGDIEEAEIFILMCGTDSTREEVAAFRNSQDAQPVDKLIEAIAQLSGILPQENDSSPLA